MPPEIVSSPVVAPVKIGKFKASKMIVKESWAVLKQDKEIMLFPIASSISTVVASVLLCAIFYFVTLGGSLDGLRGQNLEQFNDIFVYGTLLIYYAVMFFIVNFFQAGLFIIVQARFSGQNLSFNDGIRGAMKYSGKIFYWSLISATVGVVLKIISDKSRFVGKIVSAVLGATWNILTYFSLPALIIGNVSVKDSFKESASIIRKTWGESIIVNFGVALFFSLIIFLVFAVAIGTFVLIPKPLIAISMIIFVIISLVIISVVSTTLSSVFKLALFNYARTGQVPQGFTEALVKGAVK